MRPCPWYSEAFSSVVRPISRAILRRRHPDFALYSGAVTVPTKWGEGWGDDGATLPVEATNRPTTRRFGGYTVFGDTANDELGQIFRVVSTYAAGLDSPGFYCRFIKEGTLNEFQAMSPLSLTPTPQEHTGIGVEYATPDVFAFYHFGADGLYRTLVATDLGDPEWGASQLVSGSPSFSGLYCAVAPLPGVNSGFTLEYDPSTYITQLRYFDDGTWISAIVGRYEQHGLNVQWFDAAPLGAMGGQPFVTFCLNGMQYGTLLEPSGFRDPWPLMILDQEFGASQTRICKLAVVGNRLVATAWSRFASSDEQYHVNYYHLMWSTNGFHWALPEEGFIGLNACRGKLHSLGDYHYVVGNSTVYRGLAVNWLGGESATSQLAARVTSYQLQADQNQAGELRLDLMRDWDFGDDALLSEGAELEYQFGTATLDPEEEPYDPIVIATTTLDTPGRKKTGITDTNSVISRGPLKRLIGFYFPATEWIEGPKYDRFTFDQGGLYARWGTWSNEKGVGYCDTPQKEGDSNALATVGTQYSGGFQITATIRITGSFDSGETAAIVFWYEDELNYWRLVLTATNNLNLVRVRQGNGQWLTSASQTTTADTWYTILVRYQQGVLRVWVDDTLKITYSAWTTPEPVNWYTGLFCKLHRTIATDTLTKTERYKLFADTSNWPASGTIKIGTEKIGYASLEADGFVTLTRGVEGTEAGYHPKDSMIILAGCRFEVNYFAITTTPGALSVSDLCRHIITRSGADYSNAILIDETTSPGTVTEMSSYAWVCGGEFVGDFALLFWTDARQESGVKMLIKPSNQTIVLWGGGLETITQSVPLAGEGDFRVLARSEIIMVWLNGCFVTAFHLDGTQRQGYIGWNYGVTRFRLGELNEPADPVVWAMQESGRQLLDRILQGRDIMLLEKPDGSIQVRLLDLHDVSANDGCYLGIYGSDYFLAYGREGSDRDWASALVAYGAEVWAMAFNPSATRLRWQEWQNSSIYDQIALRERAMSRTRRLWTLRDLRTLTGPFDPRIELGDKMYINSIAQFSEGDYLVLGYTVQGNDTHVDMQVNVRLADRISAGARYPVIVGRDRFA